MIFKDDSLEITRVTKFKSSAMNVQESTSYVTVLSKVNKSDIKNYAQMKIQ